jgi:signal transduction histidine kinase
MVRVETKPSEALRKTAVLAVDDHAANLLALSVLVRPLAIDLVTAASGEEALEATKHQDFAAILLDIMMPGMDGLATLEHLRALPRSRTTPVIFVTAFDLEKHVKRRAYELGAVDYVVKPLDQDILLAKLRAFITLHEQADALREQTLALAAKDRYIGVLAHDLATPLSVLTAAVSRLRSVEDPKVLTLAERMERALARMTRLADDMLGFAKLAAEQLRLTPSRTDLSELCRQLLDDFQVVHPAIDFKSHVALDLMGMWDAPRLQQAISNLLSNAVKYGSGWVSLQAEQRGNTVFVSVENGGEPIEPARLSRVFEPFERGTHVQGGAGLGLFIVREIASAHGGRVEVSSDAACTRFVLQIPFDRRAGSR